ncbi:DUF4258 domain-containing protein [Desulfatirhabdium butyrativorans]|uniref:DUF4258 domain-containing protein n=1 Tax=Desulfatirhabdium butyrativorans TaxID=340467 RepID=UPI0003F57A4D
MKDFELSVHAKHMLMERGIPETWVWWTLESPDRIVTGDDNNLHYFKTKSEFNGRVLHVVVNANVVPKKLVTVFFDRRARSHR